MSKRDLLSLIGKSAGASAMLMAMAPLGQAHASTFTGPIKLEGDARGTSVLVLGAGVAGLVAALELSRAGYTVQVLEYNPKVGGRSWTLRGGDDYTELGGFRQHCEFDKGLYLNPGPWRIPYHHHAMLDYARRLNVPLEPFTQINYNAYLHSPGAFGGKPQRYRHIYADFKGHVAELLSKAVNAGHLDGEVTAEDKDKLLEALQNFGVLDRQFRYTKSFFTSDTRGFDVDPGGGLRAMPVLSEPIGRSELLQSTLWRHLTTPVDYEFMPTLFQPVGGMDRIAMALYREVAPLVQLVAKVVKIDQDARGVEVAYVDAQHGGATRSARADWCVCTIPLSILAQIEMRVGDAMKTAIGSVPYEASVKIGLQFKRRFWEEDERIYGGISYTDLPIGLIGYPSTGQNRNGKGVLLGAYIWGTNAYEFTAMTPAQRIGKALELGAQIHPQYPHEYENGMAVAWHRSPFTNGCFANWSDEAREQHYRNLCEIDGRIALAGEHASGLPAWQEGAVLSALDAIGRLHQRAVAAGTGA
jgi:monoamine oxidase